MEEQSSDSAEVEHAMWRLPESCRLRWLSVGSLGQWSACGWSVAQLHHDGEMRAMHGTYGIVDAELEVQRTIKRREFTFFPASLHRDYWPHGSC